MYIRFKHVHILINKRRWKKEKKEMYLQLKNIYS